MCVSVHDVYVCVHIHVDTEARGGFSILFYYSLSSFLETESLANPGAWLAKTPQWSFSLSLQQRRGYRHSPVNACLLM